MRVRFLLQAPLGAVTSCAKVAVALPLACSAPQGDDPSDYAAALVEPPGAYEIRHETGDGTWATSYSLDEPYPATRFLAELSAELNRLGWTPLEHSSLEPELPSSHVDGWGQFEDASVHPRVRVDQWMAEWRDSAGATVTYVLRYTSPIPGEPARDTLRVYASVWSPRVARAFREQSARMDAEAEKLMEELTRADEEKARQQVERARRLSTSLGRLVLRLLDSEVFPSNGDDDEVPASAYDEGVAPIELEVVHAEPDFDGSSGVGVTVVLSERSAGSAEAFTAKYVGRVCAVVVGDEVVAEAHLLAPVRDMLTINSNYTLGRATEIIDRLLP